MRLRGAIAALALTVTVTGCGGAGRISRSPNVEFGDADIGRQVIEDVGCGSCHRVPGVRQANGLVGPPLDSMGSRTFIAGLLPNNSQNMVRWLLNPPRVNPGTAMPNLGLTEAQAQDITAYLATLN